jgi:hypothetical protein
MNNLKILAAAEADDELFEAISDMILSLASAPFFRKLSSAANLKPTLRAWIEGQSFAAIHAMLHNANIRISGSHATIDHAVALCEGGFGYDVAMIVASLADLVESIDERLHHAIALLQKRIKYGLGTPAAIAFYEAGFADRVVASALATRWSNQFDRTGVRTVCRREKYAVRTLLAGFPCYFAAVASELER